MFLPRSQFLFLSWVVLLPACSATVPPLELPPGHPASPSATQAPLRPLPNPFRESPATTPPDMYDMHDMGGMDGMDHSHDDAATSADSPPPTGSER
jgi:hypothetical protein